MEGDHCSGGEKCTGNQREPFGPALTQSARRHLTERHCCRIDSLEDTNLSEAERQLSLPKRKQQIEHAGIAIMEDVGEASSTEHAPAGDRHPSHRGNGWGELHDRVAHARRLVKNTSPRFRTTPTASMITAGICDRRNGAQG